MLAFTCFLGPRLLFACIVACKIVCIYLFEDGGGGGAGNPLLMSDTCKSCVYAPDK